MNRHQASGSGPALGYRPGLDGLRGVAVLAVLLFHAEIGSARGGFLGVSTFYTLSGFLITSLLLEERASRGRVSLSQFWQRRARRLLPAALAGLLLAAVTAPLYANDPQLGRLRGDVVWALGYALNWRLIFEDYSYGLLFSRPSPVQHFWSLAIEGQLYVLVPVMLLAARRLAGRVAPQLFLGGLAVASAGLSAALFAVGTSADRIYYGTDTRAAELLVGCALAFWLRNRPDAPGSIPARGLGVVALLVFVVACAVVPLEASWLYRGGLMLFALVSACLVVSALDESGPIGRLLCWRPLVTLGRISYGVYVYHWPIYLMISPESTGLGEAATLMLRWIVTGCLSWLSERFFERPIRRAGGLGWPRVAIAAAAGSALVLAVLLPTTWGKQAIRFAGADENPAPAVVEGAPRYAAFGDSTMVTLLPTMMKWLRERGIAVVPGVQMNGCGLARKGRRLIDGRSWALPPLCRVRQDRWKRAVAAMAPDVAVVLVGPWDVLPRSRPGEKGFGDLSDPGVRADVKRDILESVDVLAAGGARVVWLTCARFARVPEQPRRFHLYNEHVDRFNELLFEVAALRPDRMQVVDLASYLEGDPDRRIDTALRHDGVHWTPQGARLLVSEWLGASIVEAGSGSRTR